MKINGIEALSKALKEAQDVKPIKQIVKNNTAEMQNVMQRNATFVKGYQTGTTKRSISLELKDSGFTGTVKPGTEYASYLEYGTRYMSAQPFVRKALRTQHPIFIKDLERLMGK